jgi:putative holliday junction resolvase
MSNNMRILGIDYGAKKIGIAIGDTETKIASPWMILENQGHGESIKQIKLICERESVERVVLGVPHMLRDTTQENDQIRAIRLFEADLRSIEIPVDEADETLTSAEARHYMDAGSRQQDDAVAAAIMLQGYLEAL